MTNREAHEQAAGMGLDDAFFAISGIDPDAEYYGPRRITDHIVEGDALNHQITITALGKPGAGGAHTLYAIDTDPEVAKTGRHPYATTKQTKDGLVLEFCAGARFGPGSTLLQFQNGPVADGINGITDQALLAIVIDRWKGFQAGPFANNHTEAALSYVKTALACIRARTHERIQRNVEGTHAK